jgi:hypothetical protein
VLCSVNHGPAPQASRAALLRAYPDAVLATGVHFRFQRDLCDVGRYHAWRTPGP